MNDITVFKPHDYQLYAINFMYNHPYCGLFLDMGLGKSAIALFGLLTIAMNEPIGNILIVAPKSIAMLTWAEEINKWDQLKGTQFEIIAGLNKKKREEILNNIDPKKPKIYIANVELMTKLVDFYGVKKWPFSTVIIDEYQTFKNPSAQRVKALKKVRPKINRMVGLTGTPAPRNIADLWSEITLLDNGVRLGKNITEFRNRYMYPSPYHRTPEGYPYLWFLQEGAENAIYNNIKDIAVSMKAIDHLQMPDIIFNNIICEMTPKQSKVYKQLEKDKLLELTDGSSLEAVNAGVLHGMLAQLANGAIYTDIDTKEYIELHDAKIEGLKRLIDEMQGEPIIVFYNYKHDLDRIVKNIPEVTVFDGSEEMKASWNRKEIQVLLLQPAKHAFGFNLQQGGHVLCWFSIPSDLQAYLQGNARIWRQGQSQGVIIHHLITKDSVDHKIIESLTEKNANQERILDAVKAQVKNVQ